MAYRALENYIPPPHPRLYTLIGRPLRSSNFPMPISPAETKDTAVLLINCPDRKGVVALVTSMLFEYGANILHADQHQDHDLGLFFMRVEWSLSSDQENPPFDLGAFLTSFRPMTQGLGIHWNLITNAVKPRVALFCSQHLHCMVDLLYRWKTGELRCDIPVIVSNHRAVEELAAFYGVPFEHIPVTAATRAEGEAKQLALLTDLRIDLVVLARYMQILSPNFVQQYPNRIINVHHSFLPAFTGARPYHAAHARGVKLIGASSHYVTEVLDDGPIIEQDVTRISHRDQVVDLVARGRDLERLVLSRALRLHLDSRILCFGNKTVVFN